MTVERFFVALAVLVLFACTAAGHGIHRLDASQIEMHMRIRNQTMQKRLMRQYGEEFLSTSDAPRRCIGDDDCRGPGNVWKYCIKNTCREKSCRFDSDCGDDFQFARCSDGLCVKGVYYQCSSNEDCYEDECCLTELYTCDSSIEYCCDQEYYQCPTGRCWTDSNCPAGQRCVDTYCKRPNPPTRKRMVPPTATRTTSLKPTPSKKITLRAHLL
mmetsp:Transcript_40516/g.65719  ORF Transcript_40516/g.65719 Transcript_40516/m.65719 type:complete len:214 (-) Transcript_40516:154-795(-)